jgi:glycosidase
MTDANRRLAMLWGDGDLIRNPVGTTYPDKNQITTTVADQMADENSLYNYYCKLLAIRHRHPAIARGTYTPITTAEKNLGGFVIEYGDETLILLHNNGTETLTYDLSEYEISALCDYIGVGDVTLEGTVLTLGPQTSAILK